MSLYSTDLELLTGFRLGESSAMREVYNRYMRQLCFFAEQLTANTQASEDIAAECFIKAFRLNKDFSSLEKLKGFLFTSAKNAALDYIKSEKRHNSIHNRIRQISGIASIDPEEAYIRAEARQVIYEQIEKLPEQSRQVIIMSFIHGKSPQEIAEELGIAYQTVLNHKAKGLRSLRNSILGNKALSLEVLVSVLLMIRH